MNSIETIAENIQQHYMKHFIAEYDNYLNKFAVQLDVEVFGNKIEFSVGSDHECNKICGGLQFADGEPLRGNINYQDIKQKTPEKYRQDIVLKIDGEVVENEMVWPTIFISDDEFLAEDIPDFPAYRSEINGTFLKINPFPWNCCNLVILPSAEPICAKMELWFEKWFYPRKEPNPFWEVVHYFSGPYHDNLMGGDTYVVDFGTAPPEAFCELIELVCSREISQVIIG